MDRVQVERVLEKANRQFGFIPNLMLEVSANPAVADALLEAWRSLAAGELDPGEQQVVMLAVSAWNDCHYCTAAHRAGGEMLGVARQDLERVDRRELPDDARLQALTRATWRVLEKKGWLDAGDLAELQAEGIDRAQLYEIIAFTGLMSITNYINHIHGTQLDERWVRYATRPAEAPRVPARDETRRPPPEERPPLEIRVLRAEIPAAEPRRAVRKE
jgi:AhpD family alkylhydroperoxidase